MYHLCTVPDSAKLGASMGASLEFLLYDESSAHTSSGLASLE
jgi:hypothetical protein